MSNGDTDTEHVVVTEHYLASKMYWEPKAYDISTSQLTRFATKELERVLDPNRKEDITEWKLVSDYFYITMPKTKNGRPYNTITKIIRYNPPALLANYDAKLPQARAVHDSKSKKFQNSIEYEKLLWHGTGSLPPRVIVENGWKINYAGDKNLWGRGTYFASDASYSAGYAYQDNKTGHKQLFLAKVITGLGLQCLENKNIKEEPRGYNSIVGWRHGSWIYVVYDNARACPCYLVEWKEQ